MTKDQIVNYGILLGQSFNAANFTEDERIEIIVSVIRIIINNYNFKTFNPTSFGAMVEDARTGVNQIRPTPRFFDPFKDFDKQLIEFRKTEGKK